MTRYGYHDAPENYTDIGTHTVKAICVGCGRRQYEIREGCWIEGDQMVTDDLCSEYDGIEHIDTRQHEW
jgi:hypothetical protein